MNEPDFWSRHSVQYLEMAFETDHREKVAAPDGYGKRTGDCGDTVEFYITVAGDRLKHVSFIAQGCMNTTACCNTVVHLTRGRSIERAWQLTPEQISRFLQTLPPDHEHCAELAAGAFYLALTDYQTK